MTQPVGGRQAALRGFGWGVLAGVVLVTLMYLANLLLALKPLPQLLNQPLLAVMPGFVFGFLIDTLQHAGTVVEERGVIVGMVGGLGGRGGAWGGTSGRRRALTRARALGAATDVVVSSFRC